MPAITLMYYIRVYFAQHRVKKSAFVLRARTQRHLILYILHFFPYKKSMFIMKYKQFRHTLKSCDLAIGRKKMYHVWIFLRDTRNHFAQTRVSTHGMVIDASGVSHSETWEHVSRVYAVGDACRTLALSFLYRYQCENKSSGESQARNIVQSHKHRQWDNSITGSE